MSKVHKSVDVGGTPPQPELAKHDSSVLDLAFAMDCTGSMGSYIHKAQQSIRNIVEEIVSKEKSDIHLALVEYRDHPPQDTSFVTRVLDFTPSVSQMKTRLDGCSASGGGDAPEAVADALLQVQDLSWRKEATKICVFISDAPPHGLGACSDGFPEGCPDGIDAMEVLQQIAEKGITVYSVGCEPAILQYKDFFQAMAHITGGQYVPLKNAALLAKVIIGGAQEEISLQALMEEVNQEVLQEAEAAGGGAALDEEVLAFKIQAKMSSKGVKTKKLMKNASSVPEASEKAKSYSKFTTMAEVRANWETSPPPVPPMAAMGGMGAAVDDYSVDDENSFDIVQSRRMVQKAMKKNKFK